jgi:exopolyphosphatase/guanosine-5'-triphosphate,3'-diphosphate pyrophosphatase
VQSSKSALTLFCTRAWATEFPQSAYLLREEALAWQKTPWPLEFVEV